MLENRANEGERYSEIFVASSPICALCYYISCGSRVLFAAAAATSVTIIFTAKSIYERPQCFAVNIINHTPRCCCALNKDFVISINRYQEINYYSICGV